MGCHQLTPGMRVAGLKRWFRGSLGQKAPDTLMTSFSTLAVRRALRRPPDQAGVDRHPPARDPAAPPIDQTFRSLGLVAVAQPAEVAFARPQHRRRLATAQCPAPPSTGRLNDPSHPNLRQHATSPILMNRTDRALPNPDTPRATDKIELSG
jgi:hypothetical protein